jgi:hypothetical protein
MNFGTLYGFWFTHVSNAIQGGVLQQDANGSFLVFDFANLSNPGFVANPQTLGLWDKGADVNMIVNATQTPEPATYFGATAAFGLMAFLRRGQKRTN